MTAEVPVAETDEERVQKILKEADLFINSKKEVERSFVDRALRVFNLIVFYISSPRIIYFVKMTSHLYKFISILDFPKL